MKFVISFYSILDILDYMLFHCYIAYTSFSCDVSEQSVVVHVTGTENWVDCFSFGFPAEPGKLSWWRCCFCA